MVEVGSRLESDAGRLYQSENGPAPSVTSILGSYPSPWLVDWKVKNIARKVMEGDKRLREAVKNAHKMGSTLVGSAVASSSLEKLMLSMSEDHSKADRGTRIHEGVERVLRGEKMKAVRKDVIPEEMVQVEKIMRELKRLSIEVTDIESVVFGSQPGPYAGTLDMIGEVRLTVRGKTRLSRCVIDLKTGRESIKWSAQAYAYGFADRIKTKDKYGKTVIEDMPNIHRGLIIQTTNGGVKTLECDLVLGKEIWYTCYAMHDIYNRNFRGLGQV